VPLAILAGRTLARPLTLPGGGWLWHRWWRPGAAMAILTAITVGSLVVSSWGRVEPSASSSFLAGSGGLNGGRQAGDWVARNAPRGARLLAIGPSVANVLEFYGRRPVSALSVSANPHDRNPSYTPVINPSLELREGDFQYVVWDAYTAAHSAFFSAEALRLARKFHGAVVYTSASKVRDPARSRAAEPAVIIYEVHP